MHAAKSPNTEPIPGYRLIEPLGAGGFGEVWKCEAPGGLIKAVKFVRGDDDDIHQAGGAGADQELRALQHVKSLRHPFLLSMDRVERVGGELVIVMELADRSLHDLLVECQAAGRPGVPRAELLRYFEEAAEVLDLLNLEHGLQHLDVKPRNLFLVGRHVKVGDFGLVNSLAEMTGVTPSALQMGAGTPLYAAPECFLGRLTLFSDQYSLAISYCELLTGATPFNGKNFRQMALQHMQAEPDLGALPAPDKAAVARALSKEPRRRFPSCTAFVEALRTGQAGPAAGPPPSVCARPKPATRTDVPIVDLTATPVTRLAGKLEADARPAAAPETREVGSSRRTTTESPRAPAPSPARAVSGGDPLQGMQFLECIARNPAGETWAARTADGRDRLVRFIFGLASSSGSHEAEGLARLRTLRHEGLEPMELIGGGDHRLAVIADPCEATLATRLAECQAAGLAGIPRAELLPRLGEAGRTLDALFQRHGVRHLGLTPRHLVLHNGRVRLLHFGLVELIHMPAGHPAGALNLRYAAPELFEGRAHASSDVYSLALIFYELLTGAHPFRAQSHRQMTTARHRIQPDLGLAPASDRAVLERALHPDPARRLPTCADLLTELGGASRAAGSRSVSGVAPALGADLEMTPTTRSRMRQAVNALVAAAAGELEVREFNSNTRYLLHPGRSLEHSFFARVPAGVGRLRLDAFRREWRADRLKSDGAGSAFLAPLAGGGWQRLLGAGPGLKVLVDMPPSAPGTDLTEVTVRMEPVRCGGDAARVLDENAPQLLKSLRDHLQALPDRRNQARLRFEAPVRVSPVLAGGRRGGDIVSTAKDISLRGMGLLMPCRPPSMLLYIRLPADAPGEEVEAPACVVRAVPLADGRYEVGVRFLVDEGK